MQFLRIYHNMDDRYNGWQVDFLFPEHFSPPTNRKRIQTKMSDDFDLSLSPIKKSAPTKGRRANHSVKGTFINNVQQHLLFNYIRKG